MRATGHDPEVLLRTHGLRPTRARLLILSTLYRENRHLSPEEIAHELQLHGERVSVATLYQNLRQLSEVGLLVRFAGSDGVSRYDANTGAHHHLVCDTCGRMVDVEVAGPLADLRPEPAPPEHPASLAGWTVLERQLEFRGICPNCRAGHA